MTLTDLYTKALQELGILAAGEVPSADDVNLVAANYADLYEALLTDNLVAWGAAEDVPDYASKPLAWMLAALIAPAFGITGQRAQNAYMMGALHIPERNGGPSVAERALRRRLSRPYVASVARTEYF